MALTNKQEAYVLARFHDGLNQSDAYRSAYNTENMADKTVWERASVLEHNSKVGTRLQELRGSVVAKVVENAAWDSQKLVTEAIVNLELSRLLKQMGSANGSLEIIGRATGLLGDKGQQVQTAPVTKIIINLAPGVTMPANLDQAKRDMIVEATEFRELEEEDDG